MDDDPSHPASFDAGRTSHGFMAQQKRPFAPPVVRSQTTRVTHLLLLLLVLHQLIGSQFLQRPLPGDPPDWLYLLHEYLGLTGLVVVLGFWVWTLVRRGETRVGRLLPWLSPARMHDVFADVARQLRRATRGRFPDEGSGAMISAIHGLGLLTVTAMAATGAVFFFADGTPAARVALGLHRLLANLMWAYLIGHAGLAVLHQILGDDVLSRMFWFRPRRGPGR